MPDASTYPTSLVSALFIAIGVLAGVVGYLFRHYQARTAIIEKERSTSDQSQALERKTWEAERLRLDGARDKFELEVRAEYETKHRIVLEQQVKMLASLHEAAREHENVARREFAETMEMVANKGVEASERVATVLDKFYDRFVAPRTGRKG
jgi:hypothetical protein